MNVRRLGPGDEVLAREMFTTMAGVLAEDEEDEAREPADPLGDDNALSLLRR